MQPKTIVKITSLAIMASAMMAFTSCNGGTTAKTTSEKDSSATTVENVKTTPYAYDKSFTDKFAHKTASVNGTKIHYVIGGKGDVIVLLHGYPETWHTWHKMMPALAETHTVIAVDLRGLGESQITDSGYDKRNIAEDVHQLLEGLGIKKFDLVAHDWGANVGYSLTNAYPER